MKCFMLVKNDYKKHIPVARWKNAAHKGAMTMSHSRRCQPIHASPNCMAAGMACAAYIRA